MGPAFSYGRGLVLWVRARGGGQGGSGTGQGGGPGLEIGGVQRVYFFVPELGGHHFLTRFLLIFGLYDSDGLVFGGFPVCPFLVIFGHFGHFWSFLGFLGVRGPYLVFSH